MGGNGKGLSQAAHVLELPRELAPGIRAGSLVLDIQQKLPRLVEEDVDTGFATPELCLDVVFPWGDHFGFGPAHGEEGTQEEVALVVACFGVQQPGQEGAVLGLRHGDAKAGEHVDLGRPDSA
jgi:hypothetical protein